MKKGTISVISAITGALIGTVAGAKTVAKMTGVSEGKTEELSEKHFALFLLMNQWVKVKQEGKNLSSYFEKNGYKKIAVYGMSYVGETLVSELKGTEIQVDYGIDRNAASLYTDIDVLTMEDTLAEVDAIVVTAITFFDVIEEQLRGKVDCPIISLEDILYEI